MFNEYQATDKASSSDLSFFPNTSSVCSLFDFHLEREFLARRALCSSLLPTTRHSGERERERGKKREKERKKERKKEERDRDRDSAKIPYDAQGTYYVQRASRATKFVAFFFFFLFFFLFSLFLLSCFFFCSLFWLRPASSLSAAGSLDRAVVDNIEGLIAAAS